MKKPLALSAIVGAVAIALGAFGAHALEKQLSQRALEVWDTANPYHILHALAILVVQIAAGRGLKRTWRPLGLWVTGIGIFCGGLYFYALSGFKIGAILAPVGGLAFIAGWLSLMKCEYDHD